MKKSNIDKDSVKDLLYGGINELIKNRKYFYNSSINSEYSQFTDEGKEAVLNYLKLMALMMTRAEDADTAQRAKELVINGLKGENE